MSHRHRNHGYVAREDARLRTENHKPRDLLRARLEQEYDKDIAEEVTGVTFDSKKSRYDIVARNGISASQLQQIGLGGVCWGGLTGTGSGARQKFTVSKGEFEMVLGIKNSVEIS